MKKSVVITLLYEKKKRKRAKHVKATQPSDDEWLYKTN